MKKSLIKDDAQFFSSATFMYTLVVSFIFLNQGYIDYSGLIIGLVMAILSLGLWIATILEGRR